MGDIRYCFHRYVLDDEFASYFGVDTVVRKLSSHFLVPVWMECYWTTTLRWTFCGVVSRRDSHGAFSSYK